jgi:uncharacterized protein (TIGR00251 family)
VILRIWAVPGAARTEVAGERDHYLRVRLKAPAHEGKANLELGRFLAQRADIPCRNVEIVAGAGSRRKLLRVRGVDMRRLEDELWPSA